jgi:hypothetical protein
MVHVTRGESTDLVHRRTAAYDEMVQRATNAWRTPHKDWAEPDMGSLGWRLYRPRPCSIRLRLSSRTACPS